MKKSWSSCLSALRCSSVPVRRRRCLGDSVGVVSVRLHEPNSPNFLAITPDGVAKFSADHPDVPIYSASLDDHLNEKGYIVPGLGDAGDRLYGT